MALVGNTVIIVENNERRARVLHEEALISLLFEAWQKQYPGGWRVEVALAQHDLDQLVTQNVDRNVLIIVDETLDDLPNSRWDPGSRGMDILPAAATKAVGGAAGLVEVRGLLYSERVPVGTEGSLGGGRLHRYHAHRRQVPPFWNGKPAIITQGWRGRQPDLWTTGWMLSQFYVKANLMDKLKQGLLDSIRHPSYPVVMGEVDRGDNEYLAARLPCNWRTQNERITAHVTYLSQYASFFKTFLESADENTNDWIETFDWRWVNPEPPLLVWQRRVEPLVETMPCRDAFDEVKKFLDPP